jgi:hypothetical protein
MSKRGSRGGKRARREGGGAHRAAPRCEGDGGCPMRWRFEATVNSGGRRWSASSPGARGGRERNELGKN